LKGLRTCGSELVDNSRLLINRRFCPSSLVKA
jgi:hypothetical protein